MNTILEQENPLVSMNHRVVSRQEWLAARRALLQREKELTRLHDEINAQRLELPWVKINKQYVFDGPKGKQTLADLFEGRSQLVVRHFMFGPDWEEGCVGCSFASDNVDGALPHLENHDVSYVAISRAPIEKIEAFRKRMGWKFRWVSSFENDFNYDYHVSASKNDREKGEVFYNFDVQKFEMDEMPGISVFYKTDDGDIYHTYSAYGRGDEASLTAYAYLDLTPKGRNETGPGNNLTDWVKHHDKYQQAASVSSCCH